MLPLFNDNAWWEKFKTELLSWKGTPYRHMGRVKGRGVDCTLYVAASLVEIEVIEKLEYGFYPPEWFLQTKEEWLLKIFRDNGKTNLKKGFFLQELNITEKEFVRGDLVMFATERKKYGRIVKPNAVTNHAMVWLGEGRLMLTATNEKGVIYLTYGSHWRDCLSSTFRIMKED